VAVRRVEAAAERAGSHPHDLTDVEHDHDFDEIVIVTAGRADHHLKGFAYPVAAGDVFVLQSRDRHYFAKRQGLELINVMYDPQSLGLPVEGLREVPGFSAMFLFEPVYRRQHRFQSRLYLPPLDLRPIVRLAEALQGEIEQRRPGFAVAARVKLVELMIDLARRYGRHESSEGRSLLRLGELIGSLEQRYAEAWTVPMMARAVSLSPSQLVRVFRRATGRSPIVYLIELRLRHAVRLLEETDLDVTTVAFRTGFNDSNYFARQFRRRLGTTPTNHRRLHGRPTL
jgi:AraC-like DNA-binding protein